MKDEKYIYLYYVYFSWNSYEYCVKNICSPKGAKPPTHYGTHKLYCNKDKAEHIAESLNRKEKDIIAGTYAKKVTAEEYDRAFAHVFGHQVHIFLTNTEFACKLNRNWEKRHPSQYIADIAHPIRDTLYYTAMKMCESEDRERSIKRLETLLAEHGIDSTFKE